MISRRDMMESARSRGRRTVLLSGSPVDSIRLPKEPCEHCGDSGVIVAIRKDGRRYQRPCFCVRHSHGDARARAPMPYDVIVDGARVERLLFGSWDDAA